MSIEKAHGAILLRNTMAFDRQHASEFKQAIFDAVDFARKNAPQLMVQVYIDEEKALCYSFQLFRDSEAILRHWQISDPNITQVMKYCVVAAWRCTAAPMTGAQRHSQLSRRGFRIVHARTCRILSPWLTRKSAKDNF